MKENMQYLMLTLGEEVGKRVVTLLLPIVVLMVMNLVDSITRMMAEKYHDHKLRLKKWVKGVYKKTAMWLAIIATGMMDVLFLECGHYIGIFLPFQFVFAILLTVWFCVNEFISICKNVVEMEQKLPDFIVNGAKKILGNTEKAGQTVIDHMDKGE